MRYPNDDEFEEVAIAKVGERHETGWGIQREDGWSFFVPIDAPVAPKPGMVARFYGRGIGSRVRGLYLDGTCVFYRTEAEDKEAAEIELYGASAADWLSRWDEGRGVWSIEMGGMGPGYEQAIQITAAEVLRHLLDAEYDSGAWQAAETWQRDRKSIEDAGFANERVKTLGLSGAQWGAAVGLATALYRQGPRQIFTDPKIKDRKIQVSRLFPVAA